MIKSQVLELNFNNLFHTTKAHWKFIFLIPIATSLITLTFVKTRPKVWEAKAAIKIGEISPRSGSYIDISSLENIIFDWKVAVGNDPLVKNADVNLRSKEAILGEITVKTVTNDKAIAIINQLFEAFSREQTVQLNKNLESFNNEIKADELKLKELQLSISDNSIMLKKYSSAQIEHKIIDHLINLQSENAQLLSLKIKNYKSSISSNDKIKSIFQENISMNSFDGEPDSKLIVLLVFFLSLITTTSIILFKEFFIIENE